MTPRNFANNIAYQMGLQGISFTKLCKLSGVPKGTLSKVLNANGDVQLSTMTKICKPLKLSVFITKKH